MTEQKPELDLTGYTISQLREMAFRQAWDRFNGNAIEIAESLGVDRKTVYNYIGVYGVYRKFGQRTG